MDTNTSVLILAFGAGMDGPKAGMNSAARATAAAILSHQYPGSRILLSGGKTRDQVRSEAEAMKEVIIHQDRFSVPESDVFLETQSYDTAGNVRKCVRLMRSNPLLHADRYILVSSRRNLKRAVRYFRAYKFTVEPILARTILQSYLPDHPALRSLDVIPPTLRERIQEGILRMLCWIDPKGLIVSVIAQWLRA